MYYYCTRLVVMKEWQCHSNFFGTDCASPFFLRLNIKLLCGFMMQHKFKTVFNFLALHVHMYSKREYALFFSLVMRFELLYFWKLQFAYVVLTHRVIYWFSSCMWHLCVCVLGYSQLKRGLNVCLFVFSLNINFKVSF